MDKQPFKLRLTILTIVTLPLVRLAQASPFNHIPSSLAAIPLISQGQSSSSARSPFAGQIVIDRVLDRQTGAGAKGNDEFMAIYNASY
jgi:hypothetical protein